MLSRLARPLLTRTIMAMKNGFHKVAAEMYSLEQLHTRMERFVNEHADDCQLALAVAGGGGHFLSTLSSTPGASQLLLEGTIVYDRESYRQYVQRDLDDSFRFCSKESAAYASSAALNKALHLTASADTKYGHVPLVNMTKSIGLACASALRSPHSSSKTSRAFVAVDRQDGRRFELAATLSSDSSRTRLDEDIFVGHCVLTCLEQALEDEPTEARLLEETTVFGDNIRIQIPRYQPMDTERILEQAADRILSGKDDTVAILPAKHGFTALSCVVLPPKSLVIPGSFNPPHKGHIQLAKAAMQASSCDVAWFELSITNADKPSLETDELIRRLVIFLELDAMPKHWGILLSNAPLFKQKVELLHPRQVSRSFASAPSPLHFVIGTDTLVRLIDPKYYGNSFDSMLEALRTMPCRFVVGGRLEQKTSTPVFVTGEEQVAGLPADLQDKFILLKDFRVDISSTELRQQMSST